MGNMSYCRFENTYHDLRDCFNYMDLNQDDEGNLNNEDNKLSDDEADSRKSIIELCVKIALQYGAEIGQPVQEADDE